MAPKTIGNRKRGPTQVRMFEGVPVGQHRGALVEAIRTHVTHCDHFSPCIKWSSHKKAKRVETLFNQLKGPWGLEDSLKTRRWFNLTARNRWSDFKTRKLKPIFDASEGDITTAIANRPNYISEAIWKTLCNQFQVLTSSGDEPNMKSKSQKCKDARSNNQMNHILGRTSILKWKCDYIAAFGKPPSVAETFDKAYLGIDPLTPPSCPTEESSEPLSQNPKLLAKHQVSEDLHRYYDEAIARGIDGVDANTQTMIKVFGRPTRLNGVDFLISKGANQAVVDALNDQLVEMDALREEAALEKRKREIIEERLSVEIKKREFLEECLSVEKGKREEMEECLSVEKRKREEMEENARVEKKKMELVLSHLGLTM